MGARVDVLGRLGFVDGERAQALLTRGAFAGALAAALPVTLLIADGASADRQRWLVAFVAATLVVVLPRVPWLVSGAVLAGLGLVGVLFGPSVPVPTLVALGLGLLLAAEHDSWWRRASAVAGPVLGAWWALWVVELLSRGYLGAFARLGLVSALATGLFISAGALVSFVRWSADELEPRLAGAPKVAHAWVRLRAALSRLPAGEARGRLSLAARAAAQRWIALREEAEAVKASVDEDLEAQTRHALDQLDVRLAGTTDEGVAESFRQLARVHRDTLEQLDGLRQRQERLAARAAAEAAWLETAAFTVELAPKDAARLADVAGRLEGLSPGPLPG